MQDTQSPGAFRRTLQYVLSSDMPSQHRSVLIALLTQALRDQDDERVQNLMPPPESAWLSDETQQLQIFLDGKIADSWQHADEILMRIAKQLRRSPLEVRRKATEIGMAAGIDYSIARMQPRTQPLPTTTVRPAR